MAIEYLTGLNAIVMKAIWNIEKRQGRVTIQDLVEEIKRNTGKEYHRNINVNIKMYIFDHLRMYIFAILPLDRYIFLSDKIFP